MTAERDGNRFHFVSERLCLDFVNTEVMDSGRRLDLLHSCEDLFDWSVAAGVISATEARATSRRMSRGTDAEHELQRALGFRALLREMAGVLAHGRTRVPQATLDALNDVLSRGEAVREIVRTAAGYETRMKRSVVTPSQLLVPIAESAADLLCADDLTLVKKCQNPECILFFYDTTKNHGRRWCSMAVCGNRSKVAQHYRRSRGQSAGRAGKAQ